MICIVDGPARGMTVRRLSVESGAGSGLRLACDVDQENTAVEMVHHAQVVPAIS